MPVFGGTGELNQRRHHIKKFKALILILLIATPVFGKVPERIVSGMPAITEILFAIGAGDQVVGVTSNCNYPLEAKKKQKVGGFFLNLEKIVSLDPDLVIMQEDAQTKDIKRFKKFGLPVHTINIKSVRDVMETIREIGGRVGKKREAEARVKEMRERINKIKKKIDSHRPSILEVLKIWNKEVLKIWNKGDDKRKALVIVGYSPLVVAGGGTFIDDILKTAGVENVAGKTKAAYPQYSFEKLVAEDPQYIIIPKNIVAKKQIEKSKRWRSLEAVRNGRILFIDPDILSRPGPRVVSAIEKIAEFVYTGN